MDNVILRTAELTHCFPNGTVGIDRINLDVYENEFLVITGPNGSGKSVLMKHLNGLLKPTSGKIYLRDEDIFSDIRKSRRRIGDWFSRMPTVRLWGRLVEKDTSFGPENLRLSREDITLRVEKSLENVDLLDKRDFRPHLLSGGEKRRLAVAGVLAMDSDILIFDEPFSNLDYPGIKNVLSQILSLKGKGHTVILITHDLGKVPCPCRQACNYEQRQDYSSGEARKSS